MTRGSIALVRADGTLVCERCTVADSFAKRLRGLMGSPSLPNGSGVLFPRTRSVHTHFMRFPIDVVFLDGDNRIVSVVHGLRPWRTAASRRARSVLELAAGECERLGLTEAELLVESPGVPAVAATARAGGAATGAAARWRRPGSRSPSP